MILITWLLIIDFGYKAASITNMVTESQCKTAIEYFRNYTAICISPDGEKILPTPKPEKKWEDLSGVVQRRLEKEKQDKLK